ncbi:MAG: hypothetical protein ACI865_000437 [Flavobacteriaceae bacterium]|jgi:hypothetical protein
MKKLLFTIAFAIVGSASYAQVISTFPYVEDFEGWAACGTAGGSACVVPTPWLNNTTTDNHDWTVDASGTGSASTGPTANGGADHNPGIAGGNYLYYETSSPISVGQTIHLESPWFDFTALTAPIMSYWYHMFGTSQGTMQLDVRTTSAAGPWTTIVAPYTDNQDVWQEQLVNLVAYAGQDSVQVRWHGIAGTSFGGDMAIDDILVFQPSPVDLAAISVDSLASGCGLGLMTPWVTIDQNGAVGLLPGDSIFANYNDGTTVISDTVILTAPIGPGATYNHMFSQPADFSVTGTYNITVWVNNSQDGNNLDDTTYLTINNIPLVSSFPYYEDFESGDGGWTMTNIANSSWELAVPNNVIINAAASDSMAWVTNATGLYNTNEDGYVQGPCFDLSTLDSTDIVAMDVWWNSESSWDGANLTSSIDGGATWSLVGNMGDPTNWYNDNTINGNPGGFQEGWTGSTATGNGSDGWVTACHPLGAGLAGQSGVLFRVNFGSDASVTDEGFAFDNFAIGSPTLITPGADFVDCGPFQATYAEVGSDYVWYAEDTATFAVTLIDTTINGDLIITNTTLTDTTFNLIAVFKDSLGCSSSDTTLVTIYASPYNVLNDISICADQFATFEVDTSSAYSYLWFDGATSNTSTYNTEGAISVTVTNTINGCDHTASAFLTVSVPVDIPVFAEICAGGSVIVDAGVYDSYLWSTGETTQTITVTAFGVYTVQVVDSVIGCTTFDYIEVVDGCVGLEELNGMSMSIFPNPSNGEFNYSIDEMTSAIDMVIVDVTGKIIEAGELSSATGAIDLSTYESGVYILKLNAGGAMTTVRLIKK